MPTIDFTLEDFQHTIDHSIERALIKEREHTRAMVTEMIEASARATRSELKTFFAEELLSFWDNNLAPVLEEMQDDIKVIKDIVKDHGFRISRLESRLKS